MASQAAPTGFAASRQALRNACRYCKNGVSNPSPPEWPVVRGIAGPGQIARIVVGKFGDHLPLYRREDVFVRHGLHIARSTLCDWVRAAADLLEP